ncbi:MAG: flagellar filament capping protein FliD [Bacteriodetes bacterium]|nr:flagellar filament capping protein FliD [Bacteroidota bacterium]
MATSALNTTFTVGNGLSTSGQNNTDLLVEAYRRTRQPALDTLKNKQNTLQSKQTFFNTLRSKLETLQSNTETLTSTDAADKYKSKKVVSSDASYVSVSAESSAIIGVSTLKVNQLATNDTLISNKVTSASASGLAAGSYNFSFSGISYSLSLDGTETMEQAIGKVATTINANSDSKVSAAYVKDTSTTGRLALTSKSTGADGAITFTDGNNILSAFGLNGSIAQTSATTPTSLVGSVVNNNTKLNLSSGTKNFSVNGVAYSFSYDNDDRNSTVISNIVSAINGNTSSTITASTVADSGTTSHLVFTNKSTGQALSITDTDGFLNNFGLGTQTKEESRTLSVGSAAGYRTKYETGLNAKASVNGIDVERSTNSISDVLPGVTLSLLKAQGSSDTALTLTTTVDSDKTASYIQPLLDSYNDALRYLKNQSRNSGNDSSVRTLFSQIRELSSRKYGSDSDELKYLSDVGIKYASDGTLSIDKEKLQTLLETKPEKVSAIFSGASGFAAQLKDVVDDITGSTGTAQTRSDLLRSQIQRASNQYKALSSKVDREVDTQKKEYQKLQETYYKLQGSLSQYSAYLGSG